MKETTQHLEKKTKTLNNIVNILLVAMFGVAIFLSLISTSYLTAVQLIMVMLSAALIKFEKNQRKLLSRIDELEFDNYGYKKLLSRVDALEAGWPDQSARTTEQNAAEQPATRPQSKAK
ncbi:MAG: hypothetical protein L3J01_06285 [Thiomicrorhabdus sp.]|nr:hypothetical protein [Thiomicrorhabdus sp.]